LVLDTAAFITLTHVEELATGFFTVQEVMNEVRDEKARHFQKTFPFEIKIREPSLESMKFVTEFAKKTGDFASLSLTDIKVVALVYTLEKEVHGNVDHIRIEPTTVPTIINKPARTELPGIGFFDNDDQGWITSENVKECVRAGQGEIADDKPDEFIEVACITTDFAVQNVLKQMTLNVVSIDGLVIKQIKRWTLRCFACYKICSDITKLFCPHCGYHSLRKISYTIDEEGNISYNVPNYNPSLKGTKYTLPPPKSGRDKSNDVILTEQQLPKPPRKKKEKNILDDPTLTFGDIERSIQSQKVVVGYRRNPNEPKKKYGKKNKARARNL
jgi:RNA-binding protein NOB1